MEVTGGARARWGTAIALSTAVVLLSALDAIPLVTLPVSIVLLALPMQPRWKWLALGVLLWLVGVSFPAGRLGDLSRGWSLLLGSGFLFCTLWRPRWGVLPRALASVAVALAASAVWVTATDGWSDVDAQVREHLLTVSTVAFSRLDGQAEKSAWATQFAAAAKEMALLQWKLFPALLGLQSLAALGLASWVITRLRQGDGGPFVLRPLRDFRFNDQLVWVLIAGLVLVVLPLGEAVTSRMGYNALLFMGGLYAIRGLGVLVFLTGGATTALGVVFGVIALLFLYPLVLATAFLVGLGDTWLDVRGRATLARRP